MEDQKEGTISTPIDKLSPEKKGEILNALDQDELDIEQEVSEGETGEVEAKEELSSIERLRNKLLGRKNSEM